MIDRALPVYRPLLGDRERRYLLEAFDSGWISSRGEFVRRFEQGFADFVGMPRAVSVCNGTAALHVVLAALGIGPGDEVIVPTFTYVAPVNMIRLVGAEPVFADSDPVTWQLDPADVERRMTPRTRAIVAVHVYGQACDMDRLMAIARRHRLLVVEDCAEAFGTRIGDRHVGTLGDAATFSFFGNKTITTGEGGMVIARDPEVAARIALLKNQGVSSEREYWHVELAFNYRMTNLQAAIGLAQLEQADAVLARKRQIAQGYRHALAGLPLELHGEQRGTTHKPSELAWAYRRRRGVHRRADSALLRTKLTASGRAARWTTFDGSGRRATFGATSRCPTYARAGDAHSWAPCGRSSSRSL